MDPVILRRNVEENAKYLQNYMHDLKDWEQEMKRKEEELKNVQDEKDEEVYEIRSHKFRKEELQKKKNKEKGVETTKEFQLREEALYEKGLGNDFVKKQNWLEAIYHYNKAIDIYPHDAIFFANRALCYLKLEDFRSAEIDCTSSLRLDDKYVKAYQRRASSRISLGLLPEAKDDLETVLKLEPNNNSTKAELNKLNKTLKPSAKLSAKTSSQKNAIDPVLKNKSDKNDANHKTSIPVGKIKESIAEADKPAVEVKDMNVPTKSKQNISLKDWLYSSKGSEVKCMLKPPHLRSKGLLQRISVDEVEGEGYLSEIDVIKNVLAIVNKDDELETKKDVQNSVPDIVLTVTKPPPVISLPACPKTSVQFYSAWKTIRHNAILSYEYLKLISGDSIPSIFQDALDSNTFSEIVMILHSKFLPDGGDVFAYLLGLSNVKRFRALVMFMTSKDKENIKELLKYSEEAKNCNKEDVINLRIKYEL